MLPLLEVKDRATPPGGFWRVPGASEVGARRKLLQLLKGFMQLSSVSSGIQYIEQAGAIPVALVLTCSCWVRTSGRRRYEGI